MPMTESSISRFKFLSIGFEFDYSLEDRFERFFSLLLSFSTDLVKVLIQLILRFFPVIFGF